MEANHGEFDRARIYKVRQIVAPTLPTYMVRREVSELQDAGRVPLSLLLSRMRRSRLERPLQRAGSGPRSALPPRLLQQGPRAASISPAPMHCDFLPNWLALTGAGGMSGLPAAAVVSLEGRCAPGRCP